MSESVIEWRTPEFRTGAQVMERALTLRDSCSAEFAARWVETQGMTYELAMIALLGFKRAQAVAHV
jgi:hypothetical protein